MPGEHAARLYERPLPYRRRRAMAKAPPIAVSVNNADAGSGTAPASG
jgi:hypothetical protein